MASLFSSVQAYILNTAAYITGLEKVYWMLTFNMQYQIEIIALKVNG